MNKKVKRLIIVIGILSLALGAYRAWNSSEFMDYFPGLFIGVTLIGTALLNKEIHQDE